MINVLNASLSETSRKFSMSKNSLITDSAYIRAGNISSFYWVCGEIYESVERVRSFDKSLLPIYAGMHVSIHFAYTYARSDDFRMHFPSPIVFLLVALLSSRRARTQRFSPFLSLSTFFSVCTCESRFNNSLR